MHLTPKHTHTTLHLNTQRRILQLRTSSNHVHTDTARSMRMHVVECGIHRVPLFNHILHAFRIRACICSKLHLNISFMRTVYVCVNVRIRTRVRVHVLAPMVVACSWTVRSHHLQLSRIEGATKETVDRPG